MKRWIGSYALMMVAGAAVAQAPFTITRPLDGSKVKEKVSVRFPANSIPRNGYVGIFLDGNLVEATVPTLVKPKGGRPYYEYILDVKGRGIADTQPGKPAELKAILFDDFGEVPRIVDTSSVRINIDKKANIPIPTGGLLMRYSFNPGTELSYRIEERAAISQITESQAKLGGKPAELPLDSETIRMLYAFDNKVAGPRGPEYILRMQPLPNKGKDYADLTVVGETVPKRYKDYEMAAVYMQITGTGLQTWGSIPPYIQFEGTTGEGSRLDLYACIPLPTLPEKRVRPGDSWQSRFQNGTINLEKLHDVTSVVRTIPARGEFVGVEWERGRRCAVIRNTIEAGTQSLESRSLRKAGVIEEDKFQVRETVWFDIDRKLIVKVIREQTVDTDQASAILGIGSGSGGGGAAGGAPVGGPGGPPPGFGGPGGGASSRPPGFGGPGGGRGRDNDKDYFLSPELNKTLRQQMGVMGMEQGPPAGAGGRPGGRPGFGGRTGAPTVNEKILTRVRIQRIFILE
ncbi:MAG: hypothetical protein SFX74_07935 [Fimbriimonadaceae bacterium]|nr:hypothetical protein [Fimbriimonadaceae bacterium]